MKKFLTILSIGLAFAAVSCKKDSSTSQDDPKDPGNGSEVTIWANNDADPQWDNDCETAEIASYIYTWYNADNTAEWELDETWVNMLAISIYGWTEGEGYFECNYYKTFDLSKYSSAYFTFDWCRHTYGPEDLDTIQAKAGDGEFKTLAVPVACPVIDKGQTHAEVMANCGKIDLTEFCGGKVTLRIHSKTKTEGEAGTSYYKNFVLKGVKK